MDINEKISNSPCYTLYDSVNELMALNQINQKKYMASYLIAAKQAWRTIFWNTLYVTNSVWKTVQKGDPYPYINIPKDCLRILYVGIEDHCGDIKPLYYNNSLNVVSKPKEKKCGCSGCECGGLCEDLNETTFTTKVLFTINNVDYVEKTWIKYCKNGDILEYKEVPTKKYNSFVGDGGDFNNDFNGDYSTGGGGLSDFTIVTETIQRKVCSLQTHPCGCPVDNEENECKVKDFCSCFMPFFGRRRKQHCERFLKDTNQSEHGEVKISECGTKMFFKPAKRHHHHNEKRIPDFLQIAYQTNGDPMLLDQQIQVPEYAKLAMWAGTFHFIKYFNPKYTRSDKQEAKWAFNSEVNDLIGFLNPLSLKDMSDVQNLRNRW